MPFGTPSQAWWTCRIGCDWSVGLPLKTGLPLDTKQLQECLTQMQDELPSLAAAVSYE